MANQQMNQQPKSKVSAMKKLILPATILLATYLLTQFIMANPPEGNKGKSAPVAKVSVNTLELTPQSYQLFIDSFGKVRPRTQSVLIAQVSGEITDISPQFRDGGFFEKGDVLVQLDDRDHRAEVKISESNLLSAKQNLLEEQARAKQAIIDWQRLGNGDEPNDLVLRKPQLAAAQAQVLSSQANLEKAKLVLERTKIVAPFAGRILTKYVDLGRIVSGGTELADIYATDYVEIRLPIKNSDLGFMQLPEEYRDASNDNNTQGSQVNFTSSLIGKQSWQGLIVRTEGAIDSNSQQLYVVAQIDDPYQKNNTSNAPIKIGQYLNAKITGKTLDNSLVIPNSAIYQGSYVYIVQAVEGKKVLLRKDISIRWQNEQDALISSGLAFGDQLVLTSLGQVSSGTAVSIQGEENTERKGPKNSAGKDGAKEKRGKNKADRESKKSRDAKSQGEAN